ncbi:MAG: GNAT family N-acetyltransferase [Methanimicrococcus sp.]|nr:GNAT family N-acetyltransferase [Methanimicrococcus sp.]
MSILIRKAVPSNAFEYAENHVACWRAAYKGILSDDYLNQMSVEQIAETYQRILSEPGTFNFYFIEHDKKIIGRLVFNKSRDEDKSDAGEISAMYLLSEYWGKGYGREMMDFSLFELKRMGYSEVLLWVLKTNNRAKLFYEKCGFLFDGTQKEVSLDTPHTHMRYVRSL